MIDPVKMLHAGSVAKGARLMVEVAKGTVPRIDVHDFDVIDWRR